MIESIVFAALMLTAGGCVYWAALWVRRNILGQYRIVNR